MMSGRKGGADAGCFHGGAFFGAIGERFDALDRRNSIINADVLDAWFPPAPGVLASLTEHLEWLSRTSPPTNCAGMREVLATSRTLDPDCVLTGAGSSDLIFLALREWLAPTSRALILDPTYGEYAHVLERVIGCTVDRFELQRADGWAPDIDALGARIERGKYDLVVLVNPNNPTGHHLPRTVVEQLLARVPNRTRVWIDEAYLDYVAPDDSLEPVAATRGNVFVCKSLSKVYALSGMRAAYLVGTPASIGALRPLTPPWAVSLPAQLAAVRALEDVPYYARRWRETAALRARLRGMLERIPGVEEVSGNANFLMVHLDPSARLAVDIIADARREGVYLRDLTPSSARLGPHVFRTAVKNTSRNSAIAGAIARALGEGQRAQSYARGCQLGRFGLVTVRG
ncbi:MAG TPA: histidinol-phosphate transaminase [Gemmatimonadaceae bacterium]|nr:histidinol-phosphate transaminase [Gemmatimonadaceae bacterium]